MAPRLLTTIASALGGTSVNLIFARKIACAYRKSYCFIHYITTGFLKHVLLWKMSNIVKSREDSAMNPYSIHYLALSIINILFSIYIIPFLHTILKLVLDIISCHSKIFWCVQNFL